VNCKNSKRTVLRLNKNENNKDQWTKITPLCVCVLVCSGTMQTSWPTGVCGTCPPTTAASTHTVLNYCISWNHGIRSTSPLTAGLRHGKWSHGIRSASLLASQSQYHSLYEIRKHFFTERIVNKWKVLSYVVKYASVNVFKKRLRPPWSKRELLYNYHAAIIGAGSRNFAW